MPSEGQARTAFDADSVLFDERHELTHQAEGMGSFHRNEDACLEQDGVPQPPCPDQSRHATSVSRRRRPLRLSCQGCGFVVHQYR